MTISMQVVLVKTYSMDCGYKIVTMIVSEQKFQNPVPHLGFKIVLVGGVSVFWQNGPSLKVFASSFLQKAGGSGPPEG